MKLNQKLPLCNPHGMKLNEKSPFMSQYSLRKGLSLADVFNSIVCTSQHFRCKRNNFHELFVAQFTRHRTKDARSARLQFVIQ